MKLPEYVPPQNSSIYEEDYEVCDIHNSLAFETVLNM